MMIFQKTVYFFLYLIYNSDSRKICQYKRAENVFIWLEVQEKKYHRYANCINQGMTFLQVKQNVIISLDFCDKLSYNNSK